MADGSATEDVTAEVLRGRQGAAGAVADAITRLIRPDVLISNPDVQYLHRVKDDRDILFLINSTQREQRAEVAMDSISSPSLWDPSTGDTTPIAPWRHEDGRTVFEVTLPPVGSAFVLAEDDLGWTLGDVDFEVERITADRIEGVARSAEGDAIELAEGWTFASGDNALVIRGWLGAPGALQGEPWALDADTAGWLEMRPGAWSYQLPTEPAAPYPIDVWYRIPFAVQERPERLDLLVDGFAGGDWEVYVNGDPVRTEPARSGVDSQMLALSIVDQVTEGKNLLAVRISVGNATDGLLDTIKVVGPFSVRETGEGGHAIAAPGTQIATAPWTEQGAPFLSGEGVYTTTVTLGDDIAGGRVRLEADAGDDVLEVVVNGTSAGVRLWDPYRFEVGDLLTYGENTIELRVSNTAENLLGSSVRPAGLRAAPVLVPLRSASMEVPRS
jgi:hypothetical protein